jgi:hypothetical protein
MASAGVIQPNAPAAAAAQVPAFQATLSPMLVTVCLFSIIVSMNFVALDRRSSSNWYRVGHL